MTAANKVSQVIQLIEEKLSGVYDLQSLAYQKRQDAIVLSRESDTLVSSAKKIENEALLFAISELGDSQGRMAHSLVFSSISNKFPDSFVIGEESDKVEKFGVLFSSKNIEEAELIIEQANNQLLTENPYGTDRGKNAWRRMLFENVRSSSKELRIEADLDKQIDLQENKEIKDLPSDIKKPLENNKNISIKKIETPLLRASKIPGFLKDV